MTPTEIKARIFDLQEENKKLKAQIEKLKKSIREKIYQLSEDYFLSVEIANATVLKELVLAYEEGLKKLQQNNQEIQALREKLKFLED